MKPIDNVAALQPVLGKVALLVFSGLLFVLFSLPFLGVDLLIDAVGWILVFNGARICERPNGGIGPLAALCLILSAVASSLLFLTNTPLLVFSFIYALCQLGFFLFFGILLFHILCAMHHKHSAYVGLIVFISFALFSPVLPLGFLLPASLQALTIIGYCLPFFPLSFLLWLCFLLRIKL